MKEKKKLKFSDIFIGAGLLGIALYVCYLIYVPTMELINANKTTAKLEETTVKGDVYIYSEEEKEEFREIALAMQEELVSKHNLKPGDDFTGPSFTWSDYEDLLAQRAEGWEDDGFTMEFIAEGDMLQPRQVDATKRYQASSLKPGHIFNEDLSLKDPSVFFGFTSVGETNTDDWKEEYPLILTEYKDYFVGALKNLDNQYKNQENNDLGEIINNEIKANPSLLDPSLPLDNGKEYLRGFTMGAQYIIYSDFIDHKDSSYINPLLAFLHVNPNYFHIFQSYNNGIKVNYDPFPEEYNYFKDNQNYFTTYVPSKITKIDDKTFIVDVEVDKPVDKIGATQIYKAIYRHFVEDEINPITFENCKLDLSVRINYKGNINHYMLPDFIFDSLTPTLIQLPNNNHNNISTKFGSMIGVPDWYPNEEAQQWVNDYFAKESEAYLSNSQFSIFDTIKEISNKYNAEYDDVENVIMSYYYRRIMNY